MEKPSLEERVRTLELNQRIALEARSSANEANRSLGIMNEAIKRFDRLVDKDLRNLIEEVKFLRWVISKFSVNGEEQLKSLYEDWKNGQGLARE